MILFETLNYSLKIASMAPSPLSIATSSLNRLVKEERSYHKELEQQQARVTKLEQNPGDDENADYVIKQEVIPRTGLLVCRVEYPLTT